MLGGRLGALLSAALLGAAVVFSVCGPARAADSELPEAAQACLACHSAEGLDKKLANGETLSLHVDGTAFSKSVHSVLGCAVCHADVTLENHPPLKKKIPSLRDNSLAHAKVCRSCHADKFKLYEGSIHAALQRAGNSIAPVCTDCHSPHAVIAKAAYVEASGAPCSTCHDPIFEAYAGSVHGQARQQGQVGAPACTTCHSAHDVKAAAGEDNLKDTCLGCHQDALPAHQKWLPNAPRHFQTISCPACHAPGAQRRVDLRFYDMAAQKRMAEKEGVPQFESTVRAIDAEQKGLNASQVRRLLREVNGNGMAGNAVLRGRLEVDNGVQAHQLADKTKAVRQCESCHRAGSGPFQRVTISIADPNGRPLRYAAHQEVLNSAISVESAAGFYVIGATRIKLLDVLVVLALLAGIGIPVAHLSVKLLVRKFAKRISGREDS
jgi:predicted CXXCH cytochrome family protein